MRLGKQQASGYVEDAVAEETVTVSIPADQSTIDAAERSGPPPVPQPAAILEPARQAG